MFDQQQARVLRSDFDEVYDEITANCYHAVRKGASRLIDLVNNEQDDVRRASLYALAWFPSEAPRSIPVIERVVARHNDVYSRATAILQSDCFAGTPRSVLMKDHIRSFLTVESLLLRTCAAIALAGDEIETDLIEVLLQTLTNAKDLDVARSEFHSMTVTWPATPACG